MQDDLLRRAHQEKIARGYQSGTDHARGKRDGVVVTPVEIVDFINRAATDTLATKFNTGWADPEVHVIDPFTGTGIFPARLMQTSELTPKQLDDFYHNRLHCFELDEEAAEIANQNLQEVFTNLTGWPPRKSVVTCVDTFTIEGLSLPGSIPVIIGNPPYSVAGN